METLQNIHDLYIAQWVIFTKYFKANMAGNSEEAENISDLVATRSGSSSLNGPRSLVYAAIERANLLNLSKLCIKNLIESSLKLGRTLDDEHKPLEQFYFMA